MRLPRDFESPDSEVNFYINHVICISLSRNFSDCFWSRCDKQRKKRFLSSVASEKLQQFLQYTLSHLTHYSKDNLSFG